MKNVGKRITIILFTIVLTGLLFCNRAYAAYNSWSASGVSIDTSTNQIHFSFSGYAGNTPNWIAVDNQDGSGNHFAYQMYPGCMTNSSGTCDFTFTSYVGTFPSCSDSIYLRAFDGTNDLGSQLISGWCNTAPTPTPSPTTAPTPTPTPPETNTTNWNWFKYNTQSTGMYTSCNESEYDSVPPGSTVNREDPAEQQTDNQVNRTTCNPPTNTESYVYYNNLEGQDIPDSDAFIYSADIKINLSYYLFRRIRTYVKYDDGTNVYYSSTHELDLTDGLTYDKQDYTYNVPDSDLFWYANKLQYYSVVVYADQAQTGNWMEIDSVQIKFNLESGGTHTVITLPTNTCTLTDVTCQVNYFLNPQYINYSAVTEFKTNLESKAPFAYLFAVFNLNFQNQTAKTMDSLTMPITTQSIASQYGIPQEVTMTMPDFVQTWFTNIKDFFNVVLWILFVGYILIRLRTNIL